MPYFYYLSILTKPQLEVVVVVVMEVVVTEVAVTAEWVMAVTLVEWVMAAV